LIVFMNQYGVKGKYLTDKIKAIEKQSLVYNELKQQKPWFE